MCFAFLFILARLVKDAFIEICGAVLGASVTSQQYMGFSCVYRVSALVVRAVVLELMFSEVESCCEK